MRGVGIFSALGKRTVVTATWCLRERANITLQFFASMQATLHLTPCMTFTCGCACTDSSRYPKKCDGNFIKLFAAKCIFVQGLLSDSRLRKGQFSKAQLAKIEFRIRYKYLVAVSLAAQHGAACKYKEAGKRHERARRTTSTSSTQRRPVCALFVLMF